ncbi:MAG: hypothetical protein Q9170_002182 [Blastenia crenularia]
MSVVTMSNITSYHYTTTLVGTPLTNQIVESLNSGDIAGSELVPIITPLAPQTTTLLQTTVISSSLLPTQNASITSSPPSLPAAPTASATNLPTSHLGLGIGLGIPLPLLAVGVVFFALRRYGLFRTQAGSDLEELEGNSDMDNAAEVADTAVMAELGTALPTELGGARTPELHNEHLRELPQSPKSPIEELP